VIKFNINAMYNINDKEKVLELYQPGNSIRKISSLTNIPKSTVADWLKECNYTTATEVSEYNPDEPNMPSEHPEESTFSDDPDTFQEKFQEKTGQKEQLFPGDVSKPKKIPLVRTDDSNLLVSPAWIELKKIEIEQLHQREMRKKEHS